MMKYILCFREFLARFHNDADGASAIEYAIIAGLIAVGIIVAATAVGADITALFERISAALEGAGGGGDGG